MRPFLALGCAALLGACASPYAETAAAPAGADAVAAAPAGGCFRMNDIRAHRIADSRTLYVDVRGQETWRLEMSGSCMAGASRQETLITESAGGSGMICRPIDLNLKVRLGGGMVSPCIVSTMNRLTPAEVAALPPDLRP
jgi:hypothetical protein